METTTMETTTMETTITAAPDKEYSLSDLEDNPTTAEIVPVSPDHLSAQICLVANS